MEGYTKIGRIRPNYTGTWNAETAYTVLEMVKNEAGTASYIAKQDVPAGTPLTDETYWAMVLDAGDVIDAAEKATERANKAADALAIVPTATGSVIAINDASDMSLKGLKLFGKTTQDGTPTPESPIPLVNAGEAGSIAVMIEGAETDAIQTLTAKTPNGLAGIEVTDTSLATYTDADGKMWRADEWNGYAGINRRRVYTYEITAFKSLENQRANRANVTLPHKRLGGYTKAYARCSHFAYTYTAYHDTEVKVGFVLNASAGFFRFGTDSNIDSLDAANAWLRAQKNAGTPLTITYILDEPIETPLTAEEIAAFRALHTNKPNTTIYNDGGAGMEVKYVADTKLYIDNKFAALQEAIINA